MSEAIKVERLASHHDRTPFDCGNLTLSEWLKIFAGQHEKRNLAVTYVLVKDNSPVVLGYYTLSCHAVEFDLLPAEFSKGLPNAAMPVSIIGRFAIDSRLQGKGLGRDLMVNALLRCLSLSSQIGLRAVELHAIDDRAKAFYLKLGFTPLLDSPAHLIYPVSSIRKHFAQPAP